MNEEPKRIKIHAWNTKRLCWGRKIYELDPDELVIGYDQWGQLASAFYYRGASPAGDLWDFSHHTHITPNNTRETLCGGLSGYYGEGIYFLFWSKAKCPECQRIAKAHPNYLVRPFGEDPSTMSVEFEKDNSHAA